MGVPILIKLHVMYFCLSLLHYHPQIYQPLKPYTGNKELQISLLHAGSWSFALFFQLQINKLINKNLTIDLIWWIPNQHHKEGVKFLIPYKIVVEEICIKSCLNQTSNTGYTVQDTYIKNDNSNIKTAT